MTRTEHLLTKLSEECAEVIQRACKAQRFGLGEVQDGQELNNAQRLSGEIADLLAVVTMLTDEKLIPEVSDGVIEEHIAKVEGWLLYSFHCGALSGEQKG